ncbi:DNA-binding NarL/FixJ family response regulator [Mycobacterium sp. URHB0021]
MSTTPDLTAVGGAEDYDSAVELVEKHRPAIVVSDIRMPPTSTDEGIRLARWIRTAHPDCPTAFRRDAEPVDPRERAVLAELATGSSNRTVARRMVLSQRLHPPSGVRPRPDGGRAATMDRVLAVLVAATDGVRP